MFFLIISFGLWTLELLIFDPKIRFLVKICLPLEMSRIRKFDKYLFLVRNGVIVTPPTSAGALEGITQDSVRLIALDLDIDDREGNILRSDLYTAEEAFLSGTAAEVVPIRSVDDREIGDPGPVTRAIQERFFEAVRGKSPEYSDWNEHVT